MCDLVVFMVFFDVDFFNEVLFKDVVDEIYLILREEVIENGNKELVSVYEKVVFFRVVVFGEEMDLIKFFKGIFEELR